MLGYCLKRGPVLGFQVNDGDPVGFGSAETIVTPGFRSPPGVVALGGGGSNDSGRVSNWRRSGGGFGFHLFGGWLGHGKRPSVIHLEKSSGQLPGRQVANLANWLDCQEFPLLSQQQRVSPSFRSPEVCAEFRWI